MKQPLTQSFYHVPCCKIPILARRTKHFQMPNPEKRYNEF